MRRPTPVSGAAAASVATDAPVPSSQPSPSSSPPSLLAHLWNVVSDGDGMVLLVMALLVANCLYDPILTASMSSAAETASATAPSPARFMLVLSSFAALVRGRALALFMSGTVYTLLKFPDESRVFFNNTRVIGGTIACLAYDDCIVRPLATLKRAIADYRKTDKTD